MTYIYHEMFITVSLVNIHDLNGYKIKETQCNTVKQLSFI